MKGTKIISFFMCHYTDICLFVNIWADKKRGLYAPFFNDIWDYRTMMILAVACSPVVFRFTK